MFKVMCIKSVGNIFFGETYTAIRVVKCHAGTGKVGYALEEVIPPDPTCNAYDVNLFIRLDGPCEKAILEERVEREIADLDRSYRDLVHEVETVTP